MIQIAIVFANSQKLYFCSLDFILFFSFIFQQFTFTTFINRREALFSFKPDLLSIQMCTHLFLSIRRWKSSLRHIFCHHVKIMYNTV